MRRSCWFGLATRNPMTPSGGAEVEGDNMVRGCKILANSAAANEEDTREILATHLVWPTKDRRSWPVRPSHNIGVRSCATVSTEPSVLKLYTNQKRNTQDEFIVGCGQHMISALLKNMWRCSVCVCAFRTLYSACVCGMLKARVPRRKHAEMTSL